MVPNPGGTVSKPDVQASRLVEVLERKRKQLDLEIADFKTKKDDEYGLFEKHLRNAHLDEEKEKGGSNPSQSSPQRGRQQDRGPRQGEAVQENGRAGKLQKGFGGDAVEDQVQSSYLSDAPNAQKDPVVGSFLHEHEREEELRGLFTPNYLPLLEGTPKDQRRGSREALLTPLLNPQEASTANRNTAQVFSSSATLPTSTSSASPPPPSTRPLAASVPHRRDLHVRRDSSIASLRSSMRDPKTPRSPKRVLFSIDDVVVSPSTSPVAQRTSKRPASQPIGLFDMPSAFQKTEDTRTGIYEGYHVMDRTKSLSTKPENSGSNGIVPSATPNGRLSSLVVRNQPQQASNTSPLTGGEEFEHVNREDDLFTFDEDMNMGDSDDEKGNGDRHRDVVSDEEEDGQEEMPGSSPHAGSLPIEIRWPARHASRN